MNYKRWIFVAIILFGIGIVFGIILTLVTPTGIAGLLSEDLAALEEQLARILALPNLLICIFIFIKNVSTLVLSFILSPILCLVPILSLIINGGVLSFVSVVVAEEESLGFVLVGLLPHGIFELPALIIGQAAALSFGTMAIVALFKKERRNLLSSSLRQNLKYLSIALALLLPAAIIETYITPLLLDLI